MGKKYIKYFIYLFLVFYGFYASHLFSRVDKRGEKKVKEESKNPFTPVATTH